jgi:hypothetical protein
LSFLDSSERREEPILKSKRSSEARELILSELSQTNNK